uniref:Probable RNA-binding protein 18 n=1 Tax=Oryzias latipes TaxID=8090 RepID=A0A3P9IQN4_ORYLA
MSSAAETVENASIISENTAHDGNRLWIGNIDPKITEYHLIKLLERFGQVKQFDFLFHKSGPLEGQPRGYCFVNFSTREEAERAIQCLNGKLALSKKLVVRWAHAQVRFEGFRNDKTMPSSLEPSSSGSTELLLTRLSQFLFLPSTSAKIRAIEAKLQMMEQNPDDTSFSGPPAYIYNKPPEKKRWEPYSKSHHKAWKVI